jgi:hypothetical protein
VPARIRHLSLALFGPLPDEEVRKLQYQLLHAAAATLIEAAANRTELGLFLVHEFQSTNLSSAKLKKNSADWENLVHAFPELAAAQVEKNQILGPVSVPGAGSVRCSVALYLGNLVTELGLTAIGLSLHIPVGMCRPSLHARHWVEVRWWRHRKPT